MKEIEILGLFYLIIEMIKFLYPFIRSRGSNLTPLEQHQLTNLFELHNVKDNEGRPIWYLPSRTLSDMEKQNEKILGLVDNVSSTQKDISHILERILDKLQERELRK